MARKAPVPRATTSTICPLQRPSWAWVALMRTWSPCISPAISFGGRNTLSARSSLRTKPNPARLALTTPTNGASYVTPANVILTASAADTVSALPFTTGYAAARSGVTRPTRATRA